MSQTILGKPVHHTTLESDADDDACFSIRGSDVDVEVAASSQAKSQTDDSVTCRGYMTFVVLGIGCGWALVDNMFIEVPWFDSTQPEGLKMASALGLSGTIMNTLAVPGFLFLQDRFDIDPSFAVLALCLLELMSAVLLACFWHLTVGGVSLVLHGSMVIVTAVGSLQTVAVLPWMASFNPRFISATMTGSNLGSTLGAVMGLLQDPGGARRFSVSAFFGIWIALLVLPVIAFFAISRSEGGGAESNVDARSTADSSLIELPHSRTLALLSSCRKRVCEGAEYLYAGPQGSEAAPSRHRLCALNAFMQLVTWCLLRALMPYAARATVRSQDCPHDHVESTSMCEGGDTLAWSIELSYLSLCIGSSCSSATQPPFDIRWILLLFTVPTLLLLSAALGLKFWQGLSSLLIVCSCLVRFVNGYASPLVFRHIQDSPLHIDDKRAVTQWIAIVEKITSVSTVWVMFALIQSGVIS